MGVGGCALVCKNRLRLFDSLRVFCLSPLLKRGISLDFGVLLLCFLLTVLALQCLMKRLASILRCPPLMTLRALSNRRVLVIRAPVCIGPAQAIDANRW